MPEVETKAAELLDSNKDAVVKNDGTVAEEWEPGTTVKDQKWA